MDVDVTAAMNKDGRSPINEKKYELEHVNQERGLAPRTDTDNRQRNHESDVENRRCKREWIE
jgi:hypothetical protein